MKHIWDGNNVFRRLLETGHDLRNIFDQFYQSGKVQDNVVVWDGPNSLKARRAIYPEYKAKRQAPKEDIYVNFEQIRELLTHTWCVQVRIPGFEADDIIADIVKDHENDCYIHSNDRDFLALGVPCDATPLNGVKTEDIRLYKTFVGDSSDNIPGCPNFGHKAWESSDPAGLKAWLLDGADYEFPKRAQPDRDQLLKYWKIIGFLEIDITNAEIVVGEENLNRAMGFFDRWML